MILATLRREVNQFVKVGVRVALRQNARALFEFLAACVESLVSLGKVAWQQTSKGNSHVKLNLQQSGPFFGIGGLAVAAFLYGYSAIALPSVLHSVLMPLVWIVLFVVACAWFERRPVGAAVLPVVAIALWFAVMLLLGPRA
jgi:hypothetical protein